MVPKRKASSTGSRRSQTTRSAVNAIAKSSSGRSSARDRKSPINPQEAIEISLNDNESDLEGGFIREEISEEPSTSMSTSGRASAFTSGLVSEGSTPATSVSDDDVFAPKRKRKTTVKKVNYAEVSSDDEIKDVESESEIDYSESSGSGMSDYDKVETAAAHVVIPHRFSDESGSEEVVVAPAPVVRRNRARQPRRRVGRMTALEKYVRNQERVNQQLETHHPDLKTIFEDLEKKGKRKNAAIDQPEGMAFSLLPFQREGLDWLISQQNGPYKGGVLADEMGMGKTIQTIALFLSDDQTKMKGPNLVIAPTVALMQWKNEIELHTGGKLTTLMFHGQSRTKKVKDLKGFNVILTTYAVLESAYRKQQSGFKRGDKKIKEPSPLHNMEFHRVILDEAHNIKDRTTNTARAVFNLSAEYRFCLSGTPLQNRVGELYSLIKFLKVEPFSLYFCRNCDCANSEWKCTDHRKCDDCGHSPMEHLNFFNHSLLKHFQHNSGRYGETAMPKLRSLMDQIMLRRTKLERADDLGLPPRVVEVRRDYFNEEEKDLYASIYSDSTRKFNTYVNEGVVLNNYANIFTLITRMRQVADHPDLVLRRHQQQAIREGNTVENFEADTSLVCKICDDEAEDAIKSKCHHTFCRLCIKEYVEGWTGEAEDLECPVCHIGLTIDLSAPAIEIDEEERKKGSIVSRINQVRWKSSTKIEALVEELYKLRSDRQTIKSIVFSQFTSMLDLIEWRLGRAGFHTVKLQGSMSPSQRDGIIRHFMETPSVEIFLVSLKAGGVALNLCEASQVFIMDPWWNPSVEWQSGDRVHRIGQYRPCKITRFAIEDSIESRIIELQEKKARMIQATIGQDDSAMNKLTPADLQFLFHN